MVSENEEDILDPVLEDTDNEDIVLDQEADVSGNEESADVVSDQEDKETVNEISVSGNSTPSAYSTEASVQVIDYTEILIDISDGISDLNMLCGFILFVLIATWTDRHFASIVNKFTGKGRD